MGIETLRFETQLIHSGEPNPHIEGAVGLPIFQTSTYEVGENEKGTVDYNDIRYARLSNTPNHTALHLKLAHIERAEAALVSSSGMAAITSTLLGLIGPGEHLLAQEDLYGGTYYFLKEIFPKMGREVSFFPSSQLGTLSDRIKENTRAIYVESISNPVLKIIDLKEVVRFARAHQLISLIDNTFPSPVNFNPIPFGFDVVLHSATKYLNGHSDVVAGAAIGSQKWIKQILSLCNHLGGALDPHACFLLQRGMKTLALRVRHQNASALKVATALEKFSKVRRVLYPGLTSHPDHLRAKEWFRGFGGMVAFDFDGTGEQADAALKKLKLPIQAPSLGGIETLVIRPAAASHSGLSQSDREQLGVTDSLVRLSIGLEDPDDLIEDFAQVLN